MTGLPVAQGHATPERALRRDDRDNPGAQQLVVQRKEATVPSVRGDERTGVEHDVYALLRGARPAIRATC